MRPILFQLCGVAVHAYAFFVALGFLAAYLVRRVEVKRLGYQAEPGHAWVGFGALIGAVIGAKVGMILFIPPSEYAAFAAQMLSLDFTGKTVVGGIAGGFIGVEIAKKLVGIHHSTGDAFAVAIPLGQAIGRLGCFFNGCCFGAETTVPWAVHVQGATRHPAPLYETVLDLTLALLLWTLRKQPRQEGRLFRWFLIGYAAIRFVLEPLRGDHGLMVGPLTLVQIACALTLLGFGSALWRSRRSATSPVLTYGNGTTGGGP